MRKLRFFAALCCAAAVFAACESNEPKNDSNNTQTNETDTGTENDSIDSSDSDTTKIDEVTTGIANGYDWVDLGLPSGTKWATCNVGATNPEEYGNYYAWGETTTKETYSWDTYKYGTYNYDDDYSKLTKYNTDGLTTLEATDDAATANWGEEWRMPTDAEWTELREKCTWTWTTLNDEKGYEVKGSNGNTIFLPAAGHRDHDLLYYAGDDSSYWSSSLRTDYPYYAWSAKFFSVRVLRYYDNRYYGLSVRPVLK